MFFFLLTVVLIIWSPTCQQKNKQTVPAGSVTPAGSQWLNQSLFSNLNVICLCPKLCTKIEFRHLACLCVVLSKQSCQDLMWTSAWMLFFTQFSPSRQLSAVCKLKDYCNIPIIEQNSANTFQSWPLKLYYSGKTAQKNLVPLGNCGKVSKKNLPFSTVSRGNLNCGTIIKTLSSNCMTFITMSHQQRWSSQPPEGD